MCEHAIGVEEDLIGDRGDVVSALAVVLAIGHDEFARLLELEEFVSDFLQRGSRSRDVAQVHINAFDVRVGLGIFDVAQDVIQSSGVFRFHRVEVEIAEGVVDRAIRDIIVKFHVKHRIGLDGSRGFCF